MIRRNCCALALLAVAACAQSFTPPPPPAPPAPPRRAGAPSLAQRVRQERWITRFWEQLTRAQKSRVLARLQEGDPPRATTEADAAPLWDALGLPEREALVFGSARPARGG